MAGYTPVFDSVFTGTLSGKYPDTAAWLFLLALADKHGVVDMTPAYISLVTGMPESSLVECIGRFMEPDPYSRTTDEEGRRLVPIDDARPWGWKIVNHRKYREKARLQARESKRVETGENAERMKGRRGPPQTPANPPSNTNTNNKKEKNSAAKGGRLSPDWIPSPELEAWTQSEAPGLHVPREVEKFRDYWLAQPGQKGVKLNWDATWRNWIRRNADSKPAAATPKLRLLTDA